MIQVKTFHVSMDVTGLVNEPGPRGRSQLKPRQAARASQTHGFSTRCETRPRLTSDHGIVFLAAKSVFA